jgi:hypothetical protein
MKDPKAGPGDVIIHPLIRSLDEMTAMNGLKYVLFHARIIP